LTEKELNELAGKSDHDLLLMAVLDINHLKTAISGIVPERCVKHSEDIKRLEGIIGEQSKQIAALWTRIWWIVGVGIAALIPIVAAAITHGGGLFK
jgi:hypothetical protein